MDCPTWVCETRDRPCVLCARPKEYILKQSGLPDMWDFDLATSVLWVGPHEDVWAQYRINNSSYVVCWFTDLEKAKVYGPYY